MLSFNPNKDVGDQVIIDSQPITVAILATIFYGEIVGSKSIIAMVFGILGLIIIEVQFAFFSNS